MSGAFQDGVKAEIEALREHVRRREEREERERRDPKRYILDLPSIDVSQLELPQLRALISQRFDTARLRNRLAAAERRIAELEKSLGRT